MVEPRDRGGEDPGQRVVGAAHVGDGVVEDQGTAVCCLDGVDRAHGVKRNRVVCREGTYDDSGFVQEIACQTVY